MSLYWAACISLSPSLIFLLRSMSIVSHEESISIGLPVSLPSGDTSSSFMPIPPSLSPSRFDRPNFQIYQYCAPPGIPFAEPIDSTPAPVASLPDSPTIPASSDDLDISIALRKSSRTKHPIDRFVSYLSLSSRYSAFIFSLALISIPCTIIEALAHSYWKQAMDDEISALRALDIWNLVPLPSNTSIVGCH